MGGVGEGELHAQVKFEHDSPCFCGETMDSRTGSISGIDLGELHRRFGRHVCQEWCPTVIGLPRCDMLA